MWKANWMARPQAARQKPGYIAWQRLGRRTGREKQVGRGNAAVDGHSCRASDGPPQNGRSASPALSVLEKVRGTLGDVAPPLIGRCDSPRNHTLSYLDL